MIHPFRVWLTLSAAAVTLLNLPLPTHAQSAPSSAASADSDLSAAQKAQVQARQDRFQKDMTALRADTKLTDVQKQAKYQVMLQALDTDMLAILTPKQRAEVQKQRDINAQFQNDLQALRTDTKMSESQKKAKYKTLVQKRQDALLATLPPAQRARMEKEHQAELARAAEVNRLGEQIQSSESPTQVKKIHDISVVTRERMQAVMADKTLSEQAKVTQITELRQQAQAKINILLTPKQRAQFAHLQHP